MEGRYERKRSQGFGLNNWKEDLPFTEMRNKFEGSSESLVLVPLLRKQLEI